VTTADLSPRRRLLLLSAAAVALQALTWAILIPVFAARIGYGLHDLSDISHYLAIVEQLARGGWPYVDVPFEYPPLALPFMLLPPRPGTLAGYEYWFTLEMVAICAASGVVVTLIAARMWSGLGRPLAAAASFALCVAAAGALSVNRFDPVVGLCVSLVVLALVYRRSTLAGVAVGLGFAVKLTPVVLLPLVVVLAIGRRARLWAIAGAALAAVLPFVPFLAVSIGAFDSVTGYQTGRGIQIESLMATPYLLLSLFGPGTAHVIVPPGGSLEIDARGVSLLVTASPFIVLALLAVAYLPIWRARLALRRDPETIVLAALAVLLAVLCGNKVLSPQHLLWILPLVALCIVTRSALQRTVGVLMLIAVAITQAEFPAYYHHLRQMDAVPVLLIAARNLLLAAAFVVAVASLWRARAGRSVGERGASAQAEHPERLIGDDGGEYASQQRRRDRGDPVDT
jgi:hypothetical protein